MVVGDLSRLQMSERVVDEVKHDMAESDIRPRLA